MTLPKKIITIFQLYIKNSVYTGTERCVFFYVTNITSFKERSVANTAAINRTRPLSAPDNGEVRDMKGEESESARAGDGRKGAGACAGGGMRTPRPPRWVGGRGGGSL